MRRMNKLFRCLIIILITVVSYKSGVTEQYKVNGVYEGDKYLYLFFTYNTYHKIELSDIDKWEMRK